MRITDLVLKSLAIGATLALVSGCVSRADIDEIKATQKQIIEKLDKAPAMAARPMPPQQQPQGPDPQKVYAFPVGESATKGPADALVTIIEVSEFQCPYCARVLPTLNEVVAKYGKDVRIVFKHNALPFHKRAKPAALAAECAKDQGKFWEMHDKLFENQRALEDADLESYARGLAGLKFDAWKACYTANKHADAIDADQRLANQLGARGTPAFFINGRFLSGAQPFPAFQRIIDEELAKAKASGIAPKDYYATAVVERGEKRL